MKILHLRSNRAWIVEQAVRKNSSIVCRRRAAGRRLQWSWRHASQPASGRNSAHRDAAGPNRVEICRGLGSLEYDSTLADFSTTPWTRTWYL